MSAGKIHLRGKPHGTTLCGIRWTWNAPDGRHDLDALTWGNRDHATCGKCLSLAEAIASGERDTDVRIERFTTRNRRGPKGPYPTPPSAPHDRMRGEIPDFSVLDTDDDPVPA